MIKIANRLLSNYFQYNKISNYKKIKTSSLCKKIQKINYIKKLIVDRLIEKYEENIILTPEKKAMKFIKFIRHFKLLKNNKFNKMAMNCVKKENSINKKTIYLKPYIQLNTKKDKHQNPKKNNKHYDYEYDYYNEI